MSGLNYLKLGSTLSNICNTIQLDNTTKCHHAFKYFRGEPCTLPDNKILALSKLKAFADYNFIMAHNGAIFFLIV